MLLGVFLLVLAEGSWVLLTQWPLDPVRVGRLEYLHWRMLFEPSPHGAFGRSLYIAGIGVLWQLAVKHSRRRLGRGFLVTAWIAALALGGWYAERWYAFCGLAAERFDRVFELAEGRDGSRPWVGVYGVADLAGHLTAIAPSGRFAKVQWGCTGFHNIAWGHVLAEGPYLRLVSEEQRPLGGLDESVMRFAPVRRACGEPAGDRCHDDLWSMEDVQIALLRPEGLVARMRYSLGAWPDDRQLAELRRPFERILARHPVIARAHAVERQRQSTFTLARTILKKGMLDIGANEGVAIGMTFCSVDRLQGAWIHLLIANVRESESDFVGEDARGIDLEDGTLVQLCSGDE